MIDNFHCAVMFHPKSPNNDVMNNTTDITPCISLVFPFWKFQCAHTLWLKFNTFTPKFDLGINRTMEDKTVAYQNSSDSFTNSVTTNLRIFSAKMNVVIYMKVEKI